MPGGADTGRVAGRGVAGRGVAGRGVAGRSAEDVVVVAPVDGGAMRGANRTGSDGPSVAPGVAVAPVRSDVERNHRALLQAARELLSIRPDVPLYEIARRAGVGQATLYRHFPDRQALVGALATEVLDEVDAEAQRAPGGPEGFTVLLKLLVAAMVRSGAILELLEEDPSSVERPGTLLYGLVQRLLEMVRTRFDEAHAAGVLRPGVSVEDVMLVLAMAKGVIRGSPPSRRDASAARALELALHGLCAGCARQPAGKKSTRSRFTAPGASSCNQ